MSVWIFNHDSCLLIHTCTTSIGRHIEPHTLIYYSIDRVSEKETERITINARMMWMCGDHFPVFRFNTLMHQNSVFCLLLLLLLLLCVWWWFFLLFLFVIRLEFFFCFKFSLTFTVYVYLICCYLFFIVVVVQSLIRHTFGMCVYACVCVCASIYGFNFLTLVALPNIVNPMVNQTLKTHTHVNTIHFLVLQIGTI